MKTLLIFFALLLPTAVWADSITINITEWSFTGSNTDLTIIPYGGQLQIKGTDNTGAAFSMSLNTSWNGNFPAYDIVSIGGSTATGLQKATIFSINSSLGNFSGNFNTGTSAYDLGMNARLFNTGTPDSPRPTSLSFLGAVELYVGNTRTILNTFNFVNTTGIFIAPPANPATGTRPNVTASGPGNAANVPEPASMILLSSGLIGLALRSRRKKTNF
jgi:PEP-CTERM motif